MKQFKVVVIERLISLITSAILHQLFKDRNGEIMDVEPSHIAKVVEALIFLSGDKVCTEGLNPIKELESRLIEETK